MNKQQIEGFCLNNYVQNVFDCRRKLRCGEKIKPVFYKVTGNSPRPDNSSSNTHRKGSNSSRDLLRRLSSDKSNRTANRPGKSFLLSGKSWKTSTKLPGLPDLVLYFINPQTLKPHISEVKELAQTTMADLNSIKSTKLFILNKRIQELNDKVQQEKEYGDKLKKKFNLSDEICYKLKIILRNTRSNETPEKESFNSSDSRFMESDMPLSLEELAVEVKEFIKCMRPLSNKNRSFTDLETLKKGEEQVKDINSSDYYSEYSDIEEEINKEEVKHIKAPKCQTCNKDFTLCKWRHHCKKCGM